MSAHVIVIKFIPSLLSRGKQKYHPTKKAQQTNKEIQKNKQNKTEQVITRPILSWKILSGMILLR